MGILGLRLIVSWLGFRRRWRYVEDIWIVKVVLCKLVEVVVAVLIGRFRCEGRSWLGILIIERCLCGLDVVWSVCLLGPSLLGR